LMIGMTHHHSREKPTPSKHFLTEAGGLTTKSVLQGDHGSSSPFLSMTHSTVRRMVVMA
jgi:hypothetical protein